ncbi:MAG TPA: HAD family hydrolase [Lachnospiraceae bacterium]|nr:HAD family hydrolase [Lachnospiraceae bacterium]
MKYKLAIFDMDGTILDTLKDMTDAVNHTMKEFGYPGHSLDEVRQMVGNGIRRLIERAVPEGTDREETERVYASYVPYYEAHCAVATRPYEGIVSAIRELKSMGMLTAVVSNKKDPAVRTLVSRYFDGCFDAAVGEREGIRTKPAPDSVNELLKSLSIKREESVYIGDSDVDVETAANSGMDMIAVTWGFRDRDFLREHGAVCFADKPSELVKILIGGKE